MNAIAARINAYERLMRLHRPIGILLLLWPTLWALWLGERGWPNPAILLLFVTGTVLMRSGGCAINDFADRNFDASVERTRDRPLATGAIRPWEALAVAAACALAAFAVVMQMNWYAVKLSVFALGIAIVYPFLKRFFWMPQAWLGLAFGFGIPMAFAAEKAAVPTYAWVILLANIFWTIAYDTEYAMVDRDDDVRLGLKTSAILFGRFDVAAVMLCYATFFALLAAVGVWQRLGIAYFAGLAVAAAIAARHYPWIRGRTREGCFRAFLDNNWVGAAIFVGSTTVPGHRCYAGSRDDHPHPRPSLSAPLARQLGAARGRAWPSRSRGAFALRHVSRLRHRRGGRAGGAGARAPRDLALSPLLVHGAGDAQALVRRGAGGRVGARRGRHRARVVEQTARYCGMEWLEPFVLHDSDEVNDEHLARAGRKLHGRLELWLAEHRPHV